MKIKLMVASLLLALLLPAFAFSNPVEEGKAIFMTRCAACHNVNKVLTGPALAGVADRRTEDWILRFVRSSRTMISAGDKDATALFEKFNRVPMPDHPDLTDDHIKSIIEYIKSESKTSANEMAPFAKPGKQQVKYMPLSIQKDYLLFISYLIVVGLLISCLLFVVRMNYFKRKLQEEDGPAQ